MWNLDLLILFWVAELVEIVVNLVQALAISMLILRKNYSCKILTNEVFFLGPDPLSMEAEEHPAVSNLDRRRLYPLVFISPALQLSFVGLMIRQVRLSPKDLIYLE